MDAHRESNPLTVRVATRIRFTGPELNRIMI